MLRGLASIEELFEAAGDGGMGVKDNCRFTGLDLEPIYLNTPHQEDHNLLHTVW